MAAEILGGAIVAVTAVVLLQRWYDARRIRERLNHLCGFIAQDLLRIAGWIHEFDLGIEPRDGRDMPTGDHVHILRTVEAREALPDDILSAAHDMYEMARKLRREINRPSSHLESNDPFLENLKAAIARTELALRPIAPIVSGEGIAGKTIWEWDDVELFERPMRDDPWGERGLTPPKKRE